MVVELVGGAALGTVFGALYDIVKVSIGRTVVQFKPLLGDLKFTLDSLRPRIIQQIREHNLELGLPNDDIESLQQQMEEGVKLVAKLSKLGMCSCYIWFSCCNCTNPSYTDQLVELDRSLRILLEILKLQEARDMKEALLLARKIHDKQDDLDKRMAELLKVQQEAGDILRAQQERNAQESSESNMQTTPKQDRIERNSVQGAALKAVFGVLFGAVMQVKDKKRMLKHNLESLKATLDSLKPLIEEISEDNRVLHLPNEELDNFRIQMEKGVDLVRKSSKVRHWASCKNYDYYSSKLLGLDAFLQRLLYTFGVQLARDVKESLVAINNIEKVIKQIEEGNVVQYDQIVGIRPRSPVPEPQSPTIGSDVSNMPVTRSENETSTPVREVGFKQTADIRELESQPPDAESELPATTLGLDVQFGPLDLISSSKGKQQRIDNMFTDFTTQPEMWEAFELQHSSDVVPVEDSLKIQQQQALDFDNISRQAESSTENAGAKSEIQFEPLESFPSGIGIGTSQGNVQSSRPDGAPKADYLHCTQSSQYVSEQNSDDGFQCPTCSMYQALMNLLSWCFKPFRRGKGPKSMGYIQDAKDKLLWFRDFGKSAWGAWGDFSMATVQANSVMEDKGQIETGAFGSFVGVYDGHGGPEAAQYLCDNLFKHFQEVSAESEGVAIEEIIRKAFQRAEEGFTAFVSDLWTTRPNLATVGSSCLVGVIIQKTLLVANLGDSRVVLGKKGNNGEVTAVQLSTEHNAAFEHIRQELHALHPNDAQIVVFRHNVWRVKGIIQVSRSIGDVYLKHAEFNRESLPTTFRVHGPITTPILSAEPTILSHPLHPDDSFLIFASDGLWEFLSNQEAVEIVQKHPHAGSAKRLARAALQEAAKKREMLYTDFRKIDKGIRRHFHDDITVIVLFLNHDLISRGTVQQVQQASISLRSALDN